MARRPPPSPINSAMSAWRALNPQSLNSIRFPTATQSSATTSWRCPPHNHITVMNSWQSPASCHNRIMSEPRAPPSLESNSALRRSPPTPRSSAGLSWPSGNGHQTNALTSWRSPASQQEIDRKMQTGMLTIIGSVSNILFCVHN